MTTKYDWFPLGNKQGLGEEKEIKKKYKWFQRIIQIILTTTMLIWLVYFLLKGIKMVANLIK